METKIEQGAEQTIVNIIGTIDINTANELRESLQEALKSLEGDLVINLAEVPYLDSSAIAALVECLQSVNQVQKKMLVTGANETCGEIFRIARLDKVFTFI